MTGQIIVYVGFELVADRAHVVDDREVAEVVWCDHVDMAECVPYPLFGSVQVYLDAALV